MTKSSIFIFLLSILFTACNRQQMENVSTNKATENNMNDNNFLKTVNEIKTSDIYENPSNWEARGLNPSDKQVIITLRKATNDFLDRLVKIHNSNESSETKLKQISNFVDELPWDELDTEEKEFMADTLAPAIAAAGFDPWTIF
jgi:hypothetical protein